MAITEVQARPSTRSPMGDTTPLLPSAPDPAVLSVTDKARAYLNNVCYRAAGSLLVPRSGLIWSKLLWASSWHIELVADPLFSRYKFDAGLSAPQGSTSDPRWGQYEVKRPSSAAPLTFSTPQLIRQSHPHAQRPSGAASLHDVGGREGGSGSGSVYRDGNANGAGESKTW